MAAVLHVPRDPLLPDLEGSHAVLVGCGSAAQHVLPKLAARLSSPRPAMAFQTAHTTVRITERPDRIVGALRPAAAAAADVLLFLFVAPGDVGADLSLVLEQAAGLIAAGPARRPVVIIDCAQPLSARPVPAELFSRASLMYPVNPDQTCRGWAQTWFEGAFTAILLQALDKGIWQGPALLDLRALATAADTDAAEDAMWGSHDSTTAMSSTPPPPTEVRTIRKRNVALGANCWTPGGDDRRPFGMLLADEDALFADLDL